MLNPLKYLVGINLLAMSLTLCYEAQDLLGISLDPTITYDTSKGSTEGGSLLYISGQDFDGKLDSLKIAFIALNTYKIPRIIYIYIYI